MAQVPKTVNYDPATFGQGDLPAVGKYHVVILKATEPDAAGQCLVDFQVLAGTTPGQEAKIITDRYFPFKEKAAERLKHLWYITNVATLAQINNGDDIPMSALEGRQLLIDVSMGKDYTNPTTGKHYPPRPQVSWKHEAITCMEGEWAAVPRHQGALKGELNFDDTPGVGPLESPGNVATDKKDDLFDFG